LDLYHCDNEQELYKEQLMSVFTPSRRWQPAFYPFKGEKFSMRLLAKTELLVKGPLYGCRMCGNCLLQETAFICPMECPKGLRNGPCGGAAPDKCYVDESRKCIWYCIYNKAVKMGREEKLMEVLPPLDWEKTGTETWGDVAKQIKKVGTGAFISGMLSKSKAERNETWESVFKPVRQPEWWKGDSDYHPPQYTEPVSELERRLSNGEFVVTSEIIPPLNAGIDKLKENIELIRPYVTAVNFTDSSSSFPRMSSFTCCTIAAGLNTEPVLQIAARDNTRSGLQSRVIGAENLGIHNILCLSGDSPKVGPSPRGNMQILDVDSVQMLWILRRMRDDGIYLDGRQMKNPPKYFLGAAASPFASEPHFQAIREHKKINAGAQFLQTNLVFDADGLDRWLEQLDKRNILEKAFIIVGISPLRSMKIALHLNNVIPGVTIPDTILKRIEKAGASAHEEGIVIALELIDKIKRKQGINGIHLMTFGCESTVKRITEEAGLSRKGQ
jgi:methylenetetrahydrofolate reductase (NADPH)